jgi:hypothetical protein
MNLQRKPQSLLLCLLIASIISTGIHFTDNFLFYQKYPQPEWITLDLIYISWVILTFFGLVGYWLYRVGGNLGVAYVCLCIYSLTGLSSLGHYLYGAMSEFSVKMHLFIWTDALTGMAVLGFVFWSGLFLKEWSRDSTVAD